MPETKKARVFVCITGEPIAKGRPRVALRGDKPMAYTPKKTRDYEARLKLEATDAMAGRPLLTGPLLVVVKAFLGMPKSWSKKKRVEGVAGYLRPIKRPDLDNLIKNLDALNGTVFLDDSQVVEIYSYKFWSDFPRLELAITPITIAGDQSDAGSLVDSATISNDNG